MDGKIHHQKEKDKLREEYLESKGFTIIRFDNHEVLNKSEVFLETVEKLLLPSLPLGETERGFMRRVLIR